MSINETFLGSVSFIILSSLAIIVLERLFPARSIERRGFDEVAIDVIGVLIYFSASYLTLHVFHALLTQVGEPSRLAGFPPFVQDIVFIVCVDLGSYIVHKLMHTPGIGWRMHYLHHTSPRLYCISGLRNSFVHRLFGAIPFFLCVLVIQPSATGIAILSIINSFDNLLIHSDIRIPIALERALSWVFVTPRFHRSHHDIEEGRALSNYGSVLSIWDYIFNTRRSIEIGADELDRQGLQGTRYSVRNMIGI